MDWDVLSLQKELMKLDPETIKAMMQNQGQAADALMQSADRGGRVRGGIDDGTDDGTLFSGAAEPSWSPIEEAATLGTGSLIRKGGEKLFKAAVRGMGRESSEAVARRAPARQFSQTPLPRPAPGTRIKSTGPGVRPRTPATTMTEAAQRGASESAGRVAPARVPQGGLETRGFPSGTPHHRASRQLPRAEHEFRSRLDRLEPLVRRSEKARAAEVMRMGGSREAARREGRVATENIEKGARQGELWRTQPDGSLWKASSYEQPFTREEAIGTYLQNLTDPARFDDAIRREAVRKFLEGF